eukprot:m.98489 g.98489  ORF g.98489 m.98489 type:complete len:119 (-) comp22105_c4_seq2:97-453(-)
MACERIPAWKLKHGTRRTSFTNGVSQRAVVVWTAHVDVLMVSPQSNLQKLCETLLLLSSIYKKSSPLSLLECVCSLCVFLLFFIESSWFTLKPKHFPLVMPRKTRFFTFHQHNKPGRF